MNRIFSKVLIIMDLN